MHQLGIPLLIVILIVLTAALVGWHLYLWRRLVHDTIESERWRKVGLGFLLGLALLIPVTSVLSRQAGTQSWRALYYAGYGWLGLGMLITVALFIIDAVKFVIRRATRGHSGDSQAPEDDARRQTMARLGAAVAVALGLGETAIGVQSAFGPWVIERWRVKLRNFPEKLRGFRLVQLMDVHVGATRGEDFLKELTETVNELEPDAVVITGDLVDGSVPNLEHKVRTLSHLKAPRGVFFVTGNHEYYSGAEEWIIFLRHLGLHVLTNERMEVGVDGATFDMVGVNDWTAERFTPSAAHNLPRAMKGADNRNRVQVLLAHQPISSHQASEMNIDLQLSGHTHGGQIFPWNFLVRLQQPFVKGMHRVRDTLVYVSRGTGFWGPPMRVGAPPEISLFILDRADGDRGEAIKLTQHG